MHHTYLTILIICGLWPSIWALFSSFFLPLSQFFPFISPLSTWYSTSLFLSFPSFFRVFALTNNIYRCHSVWYQLRTDKRQLIPISCDWKHGRAHLDDQQRHQQRRWSDQFAAGISILPYWRGDHSILSRRESEEQKVHLLCHNRSWFQQKRAMGSTK